MTFKPVQTQDLKLTGSGISAGATSISVQSLLKPTTSTTITMTDFGSIGYGVIEPGTTREENFSFTGVTQNADGTATFTGVSTGLDFVSPYSSTVALKYNHAGNSLVRISNTAAFYSEMAYLENDQTFTGINTFPASGGANAPRVSSAAVAPALDTELATKRYVDETAIAGAPDATTTVKGIVEIATQAEVDAGDDTGGTTATVVVIPSTLANVIQDGSYVYAADSVGTDTYAITLTPAITAYVTGQEFNFKAGTANTGSATLNVNALGAKNILKNYNETLETGDIVAGQIVTVVYDGTQFQLQSPSAATMATALQQQLDTGYSANVTGTNLATLTAGAASDADALHTHPDISDNLDLTVNSIFSTDYHTFSVPCNAGFSKNGTASVASLTYLSQTSDPVFYDVLLTSGIVGDSGSQLQFSNTKRFIMKWRMALSGVPADATSGNGVGMCITSIGNIYARETAVGASIRFVVTTGNIIYAITANGTTVTSTNLGGHDTTMRTYLIDWDPGVNVKFYIDGTLVATHTTNIPTVATDIIFGMGGSRGGAGSGGPSVIAYQPVFSLEI